MFRISSQNVIVTTHAKTLEMQTFKSFEDRTRSENGCAHARYKS